MQFPARVSHFARCQGNRRVQIRRPLTQAFSLAAVIAVAAACSDPDPVRPLTDGQPNASVGNALGTNLFGHQTGRGRALGLDAQFRELGQRHQGFAGMYADEAGTLVVRMKRGAPALTGAARAELNQIVRQRGRSAGDLVVRESDYDFLTLNAIRSRVDLALALPGVHFTDIDERRNRVTVGVDSDLAAAELERALLTLGVERATVHITITEPIRPMATILDEVRPVAGGLQIVWPANPGFVCTLGFNVRAAARPNVRGFVTTSHCTLEPGVTGATAYFQPTPSTPNALIGTEAWDRPFIPCHLLISNLPADWRCRWSDAAGVRYVPGVEVAHGKIQRTMFPGTTTAGSIDIDPDNPHFTIVQEKAFPLLGDVLHKVGRTSGWTMGPVVSTCVNVSVPFSNPTILLVCQDLVEAFGRAGDSGAPVFERIGSTGDVRLTGLFWGSSSTVFALSSMDNIRFENEGPLPWTTF